LACVSAVVGVFSNDILPLLEFSPTTLASATRQPFTIIHKILPLLEFSPTTLASATRLFISFGMLLTHWLWVKTPHNGTNHHSQITNKANPKNNLKKYVHRLN
jgi:hypothetical protein